VSSTLEPSIVKCPPPPGLERPGENHVLRLKTSSDSVFLNLLYRKLIQYEDLVLSLTILVLEQRIFSIRLKQTKSGRSVVRI